jgi:NADH-quinone oxidoreductase subunit L
MLQQWLLQVSLRLNYLFRLAQTFNIIAIVETVTSLVAATIALVQTDIKKKCGLLYRFSIGINVLGIGSRRLRNESFG